MSTVDRLFDSLPEANAFDDAFAKAPSQPGLALGELPTDTVKYKAFHYLGVSEHRILLFDGTILQENLLRHDLVLPGRYTQALALLAEAILDEAVDIMEYDQALERVLNGGLEGSKWEAYMLPSRQTEG